MLISGAAMSLLASFAFAQGAEQGMSDTWKFSVGMGVVNQAKYPGASKDKTYVLPMFSANYGRYFIGALPGTGIPVGVGMSFYKDQHWNIGAGLGYNFVKPRKESYSERLRGLGDIDSTALGSILPATPGTGSR